MCTEIGCLVNIFIHFGSLSPSLIILVTKNGFGSAKPVEMYSLRSTPVVVMGFGKPAAREAHSQGLK